ncbi:MAG: hypothetical protein EON86_04700 [Brevundimonas sp.]|nr:MAG: hypothetical protein EON86_04700 [Brevundimonas sp.]
MTDEKDHNGQGGAPLEPFPAHRPDSPFPPLYESLPAQDPPSDWNQAADAHDLPITPEPARANPLAALGRFAFPPGPPLDDEGLAARDLRWTTQTLVIATVFLLVFNAVSPLNWSHQQAPGWVSETVEKVSEAWVGQLAQLGSDLPRQGLRDAWFGAKDARFPGQAPPPPRPDTP